MRMKKETGKISEGTLATLIMLLGTIVIAAIVLLVIFAWKVLVMSLSTAVVVLLIGLLWWLIREGIKGYRNRRLENWR